MMLGHHALHTWSNIQTLLAPSSGESEQGESRYEGGGQRSREGRGQGMGAAAEGDEEGSKSSGGGSKRGEKGCILYVCMHA